MAKKKNNFNNLSKGELNERLVETREALRVHRFKAEGARSKNVKETLLQRREIARILTELNKK